MTDAPRWPDLAGRLEEGGHVLPVRVYYEDTDFSGMVYHANYLKFCERGRSDFLRLLGVHHKDLAAPEDPAEQTGFTVTRMESLFRAPARIDDVVEVRTRFLSARGARFDLNQRVERDGDVLFEATLTAALIDGYGRPKRFPRDILKRFEKYLG